MTERLISYREAINEALRQEMRRDPSIILMGEDIAGGAGRHGDMRDAWGGVMGVTKGLIVEFGEDRVIDTPISETGFIGAAVGAAAMGLRPVVELMFVGFMGVCLEQIFNQAAKVRYMFGGQTAMPLTIRTMIGGGMGAAAQHSTVDYSVLAHFPGLKCVAPSTPYDAKGLLIAAIRGDDPVMFCEHKMLYGFKGHVPEEGYVIPLGKGDVKKVGRDVTVVAFSKLVHTTLRLAEDLEREGTSIEVIDPRSISPLDEETILESVKKTHRLVVVDEDNPRCSIATDIIALVARKALNYLDAAPQMVTPPHTPVPFSPALENFYIPSAERITGAIREVLA
jgi:pyruvate dehydrogenase E1 component beta subunit